MAIKKGIEPGDTLWKRIDKTKATFWNSATGRHEQRDVEHHYVYRLVTRRARTHGDHIGKNLYPFFNSLGIKTIGYSHAPGVYIAVGVTRDFIMRKDEFDAIEINPIAQECYDKLSNRDKRVILEEESKENPKVLIEFLLEGIEDDESEVDWPTPPTLPIYQFN